MEAIRLKVAIYVRVSTEEQSYEKQKIELEEFCKRSNYLVYRVYSDKITGSADKRPAFDEMFEDAHKKMFDAVVFWDLSRFSRSGTLFTLQKLRELQNLGIDWISYQEPYFKSIGEFKDVVISIMATLARIEREKISERVKLGKRRSKKKQGRKVRALTQLINKREEMIKLKNEGLSYQKIAKKFTYEDKYKKIKNPSWLTIRNIIKNTP